MTDLDLDALVLLRTAAQQAKVRALERNTERATDQALEVQARYELLVIRHGDALVAEVERLRKQREVAEMLATRAWQLWAGLPTELQESEAGQRFIGAFGGFSAYFEERSDD